MNKVPIEVSQLPLMQSQNRGAFCIVFRFNNDDVDGLIHGFQMLESDLDTELRLYSATQRKAASASIINSEEDRVGRVASASTERLLIELSGDSIGALITFLGQIRRETSEVKHVDLELRTYDGTDRCIDFVIEYEGESR